MRKLTWLGLAVGAGLVLRLVSQRQRQVARIRNWHWLQPGTAVITGASSGIGRVFALALAQRGYGVVLVARREERLRALQDEIRAKYGTPVEVLVANLDNQDDVVRVAQRLGEIPDLDLLVNNAGFGLGGNYSELPVEDSLRMVRVHVMASMHLARAVLPTMVTRRHGGIINVSSMAAFTPVGGNTIYGATKAYLNFFSEALQQELYGTGVRVQALCPGFTYTEIHDKSGRPQLPGFLWLVPEMVVAESLKGLEEDRLYVIPGRLYRLGATVTTNSLTGPLVRWLRNQSMRRMKVKRLPVENQEMVPRGG